ncbi:MAG: hypothetical protein HUJ68_02755 [Clostridia bacterium]|nr:hypothetical protein [Clostridia bacterium]
MFEQGQKVKIKHLSTESYLLYKHYKLSSPLIICPCKVEDQILEVVQSFENRTTLLRLDDNITIVYTKDLILC